MHQAQFAGVYVAQAKGIYQNYGLNVEILSGGPNLPAADAIRDNKADICSMFLLSAMREYSKGNRVVNLAQVFQKSSLLLVAKKDKGINTLSDINGKKIALWRSDFQEISLMFIKKNRLNVEIVPIDWSINLFMQDGVDLMNVMLYNEYNQLIQSGLNREELVVFPMSKNGFDIPEDGLYCTDEYWLENPALCKDFADATMEGWMYAINNQEEAVAIVLDVMRKAHLAANRPHQEWMLSQLRESILYHQSSIGKLRKPDFEMAYNLLIQTNLIETPIDYKTFIGAR
jgi:NitT/TauT family transport system substrate-binding protein